MDWFANAGSSEYEAKAKTIGFLVIVGGRFIYRGLKDYKIRRQAEDTANSKIATAPQGLVEFEGQAWPVEKLIQNIDGQYVCYIELQIQRYVRRGKNSEWETQHRVVCGESFILADKTGACLVESNSANLELQGTITRANKLTALQLSFIKKLSPLAITHLNKSSRLFGFWEQESFRVIEKKIFAGGPVFVRGSLTTKGVQSEAMAAGDFVSFTKNMHKMTNKEYQLKMFDTNFNGSISEEELRKGMSSLASIWVRKEGASPTNIVGVMNAKSSYGLFITDTHQKYLIARKVKSAPLKILGGLIFIVMALGILGGYIGFP